MKVIGERRVGFWIMLVLACLVFVCRPTAIHQKTVPIVGNSDRLSIPEIGNAPIQYDLSIESSGFNPAISEHYRLSVLSVFYNRIVPLNFNVEIKSFIPSEIKSLKSIPIFIWDLALLN